MALITEAEFLDETDKLGAALALFKPVLGDAYSVAGGTVADLLEEWDAMIYALEDPQYGLDLKEFRPGSNGMCVAAAMTREAADYRVITRTIFDRAIRRLEAYFSRFGVSPDTDTLDRFCAYNNGGAVLDFTCLLCPEFAEIFYLCKGGPRTFDTAYWLTPTNVFSPVIANMGTYTIATSAFVDGSAVDLTRYGAVEPIGKLTTSTNGTCAITVTGKNQAGTGSRIWTGAADSETAPFDIVLTPAVGADRLTDVTGIAVAGTATLGVFHIESILERVIA